MRTIKANLAITGVLLLCQSGLSQNFFNLNFESAVIVTSTPSGYGFNDGIANVPGWTEYNGTGNSNYSGGMSVVYNDEPLDLAGVSLVGTNNFYPAIQGRYSILLYGGTDISEDGTNGAAIGQTGQIPLSAQSMTFWAVDDGNLQVTFNGQIIPYTAISDGVGYTVFGADISAYAGQTGQLLFTAPIYDMSEIDNIQFSSSPVPEPGIFSLCALGGLFFALGYRKKAA